MLTREQNDAIFGPSIRVFRLICCVGMVRLGGPDRKPEREMTPYETGRRFSQRKIKRFVFIPLTEKADIFERQVGEF
jgi:hypothetical protein